MRYLVCAVFASVLIASCSPSDTSPVFDNGVSGGVVSENNSFRYLDSEFSTRDIGYAIDANGDLIDKVCTEEDAKVGHQPLFDRVLSRRYNASPNGVLSILTNFTPINSHLGFKHESLIAYLSKAGLQNFEVNTVEFTGLRGTRSALTELKESADIDCKRNYVTGVQRGGFVIVTLKVGFKRDSKEEFKKRFGVDSPFAFNAESKNDSPMSRFLVENDVPVSVAAFQFGGEKKLMEELEKSGTRCRAENLGACRELQKSLREKFLESLGGIEESNRWPVIEVETLNPFGAVIDVGDGEDALTDETDGTDGDTEDANT